MKKTYRIELKKEKRNKIKWMMKHKNKNSLINFLPKILENI